MKEIDIPCPKCNSKIVQRKTRKGRIFYGCSSYPACDFAAWKIEDIKHPNLEKKEVTDSTGEKTKIIKSAKKRNMVKKVVSRRKVNSSK